MELDTVVCGDCLDVMADMEPNSVKAVITDPPYFLPAYHYQTRKQSLRRLTDLSMLSHFYRAVFEGIDRVLSPDGFIYVFCDGQSYPVFFATAYEFFKSLRPLIWDKMTSINGYSWRHQHELILFGERQNAPAVPTGDGDILRTRAVPVEERLHPAQKPEDLIRSFVHKSTNEGDLILDPFIGSGTTAIVALRTGRRFYGCDNDARYAELANQRIAKARLEMAQIN